MKSTTALLCVLLQISLVACAQEARPGLYDCEGCEAIYEHSFDDLGPSTTIPPENEPGERLVLSGTVYETDGTTPAPGVIVYAHHTNAEGVYPTRGDESGWARRHGYLRGWVKSDENGRYQFNTIRPGHYPSRNAAAHIHLTVKEPGQREYWVDAVKFEGDPYLDERDPNDHPQGGSGRIELSRDASGVWHGERDIYLEPHPMK